jgi:hypothetical protein
MGQLFRSLILDLALAIVDLVCFALRAKVMTARRECQPLENRYACFKCIIVLLHLETDSNTTILASQRRL